MTRADIASPDTTQLALEDLTSFKNVAKRASDAPEKGKAATRSALGANAAVAANKDGNVGFS